MLFKPEKEIIQKKVYWILTELNYSYFFMDLLKKI